MSDFATLPLDLAGLIGGEGKVKVFFDIGANRGEATDEIIASGGSWKAYLFEPGADLCAGLESKYSGQDNITIVNKAVSSQTGQAQFFMNDIDATNSLLPLTVHDNLDGPVQQEGQATVEIVTLDDYCQDNRIDHVGLLKFDIQGMEYPALQGMSQMLGAGNVDVVCMEAIFVPVYDGQCSFYDCGKLLESHGYQIHSFTNNRFHEKHPFLLKWADVVFLSPKASRGG